MHVDSEVNVIHGSKSTAITLDKPMALFVGGQLQVRFDNKDPVLFEIYRIERSHTYVDVYVVRLGYDLLRFQQLVQAQWKGCTCRMP